MSNAFSYWNGQPVNAPVYPQMGDLMQQTTAGGAAAAAAAAGQGQGAGSGPGGLGGWPGQAASAAQSPAQSLHPFAAGGAGMGAGVGGGVGAHRGMSMANSQQMGMGDYSNISSPLTCNVPTDFFSQGPSGPFEPCIDNGEAFCAYNGMDMSMNYGGGGASKGGFW
ncbi:spidroin-1 [Drosophila eugracilis]|uniref:spidroin-1 n=1 Tax=Drosophila eugracilis TaxID=29029 RepID=UPI0007E75739|nr:spidroin-1 [Drosophila eugracilis]